METRPGLGLLLLAAVTLTAAPNQPIEPRVTLVVNDGFCESGSQVPLKPAPPDPPNLRYWGGSCHVWEDLPKAFAQTSIFKAPKFLRLYTVGWAESPKLWLERVQDGARVLVTPWDPRIDVWSRHDYALPADWQGSEVRLVFEGLPPRGLWRAFSEPVEGDGKVAFGDAWRILSITAMHFVILMMGALALTGVAIVRGVRSKIQAALITLAGTAVPGYCMFWLTVGMPRFSRHFAFAFMGLSLLTLIVSVVKLDAKGRALLFTLRTPLLLTAAVSLMVLSSGFLYGGMTDALNMPRGRYLPRLPPDNELPYLLSAGARLPHVPHPLQGDWLSSDRPPLQSGMVLAQYPLLTRPREQGYTALSALAQSLWIFALWILLTAFELNPRAIALALALCIFSGFAFLNTFFVWPKMLSAAFALGFLASFVVPCRKKEDSWLVGWVLPGAMLAFSLLAHGGGVFAVLAAVPLIVVWKRTLWRRMLLALAFGILFYSPWMAYQKLYDPPGNRLLKMHLAGVDQVDRRPFVETLKASYGALSRQQMIEYKINNFNMAFGEGCLAFQRTVVLIQGLLTGDGWASAARRGLELREQIFFHPAATLGLLIFAPYALLPGLFVKRRRSAEWQVAGFFWIFVFVAMTLWCLLMFGPASTVVHQGSYAVMLLAMTAGVLSFWALSKWLAVAVVVLQISVSFLLNEWLSRIAYPRGILPQGVMHLDTLILLGMSVCGVGVILRNELGD